MVVCCPRILTELPHPRRYAEPSANIGTNSLRLWKFHVDWANAANTTLTGPNTIALPAFTRACSGGTCIPQPELPTSSTPLQIA